MRADCRLLHLEFVALAFDHEVRVVEVRVAVVGCTVPFLGKWGGGDAIRSCVHLDESAFASAGVFGVKNILCFAMSGRRSNCHFGKVPKEIEFQ